MKYFKCIISKQVMNTVVGEEVWLPEAHAIKGKTINLRIDGEWDYGWTVIEVTVNVAKFVIESKDISTCAKPTEKVYRGKNDDFKYQPFTPRDKDHQ
jgi:hypothetical protein